MVQKRQTSVKSATTMKPLQNGQVWRLAESSLEIRSIGKLLVHYKHYKTKANRTPESLAAKKVLEDYLRKNKAVLVQE